MKTLWAYGCSWTQGSCLADNSVFKDNDWDFDEYKTSKYSWPNILSKKLNISCNNKGKGGNSNQKILQNIIDDCDNWHENDIIIVMWTGYTRFLFYEDKQGTNLVNNIDNVPFYKSYLKESSKTDFFDCKYKTLYYMKIVEKLHKNIIHTCTDFGNIELQELKNVNFHENPFVNDCKALDKEHPGQEWHKKTANFLEKIVING